MYSIKNKNIPVAGPWITEKEISYVTDAVENDWYENANTYIHRFETAFAKYLGRTYAISLPSCTSGLHLSLLALGITFDDEVIVPDATWIASAAPISYVGAKPIFVDIDLETWCLSKETILKSLTSKTKAIIAVNLYGHMPIWDELLTVSKEYGIPIIEDSAESIGSRYNNQLAGTFGLTSCFSFHGSKTLVSGEGGMLVTDSEEIYNKCIILRDHGRMPGDIMFRNIQIGYKYKMSSLQAALGLAQLERVEALVGKKRQIFDWYQDAFSDIKGVSLNPFHPETYNSYWMSTLVLDPRLGISKDEIMNKLKKNNIHTRPFFDPLSSLIAYQSLNSSDFSEINKNTYSLSKRSINLPSALMLQQDDIRVVRDNILAII